MKIAPYIQLLLFLLFVPLPVRSSTVQYLSSCQLFNQSDNNMVFILSTDLFPPASDGDYSGENCIFVSSAANITLDGNGYTIYSTFPSLFFGIDVADSYNITVMNFVMVGWTNGISYSDSPFGVIVNNTIKNGTQHYDSESFFAIYASNSPNIVIQDNMITQVVFTQVAIIPIGLQVFAIFIVDGPYARVIRNTIFDLTSHCLSSVTVAGLFIQVASNAVVTNNIISNIYPQSCTAAPYFAYGIYATSVSGSQVANNTIDYMHMNNQISLSTYTTLYALSVMVSDNVIIEHNNITNIQGSLFNAWGPPAGIYLMYSSNCTIFLTNIATTGAIDGGYSVAIYAEYSNNITFEKGYIADVLSDSSVVNSSSITLYEVKDFYVVHSVINDESFPPTAWCFSPAGYVSVASTDCEEYIFFSSRDLTCRAAKGDCDVEEYFFYNNSCPLDSLRNSFSVCRNYTNCADLPDSVVYCTGYTILCPEKNELPFNCTCGNGVCDNGENCSVCYRDCKHSFCNIPGDRICGPGENCTTSFYDCNCAAACAGAPPCGGFECISGVCLCEQQWSGIACSASTVAIIAVPSVVRPVVDIIPIVANKFSNQNITIYVSSIVERNSSNGEEKIVDFADLTFTMTEELGSTGQTWAYHTMLENNQGEVMVQFSYFNNSHTFEFAEQYISIPPQSVKLNIRVQNWPFLSLWNSLLINIKVTSTFRHSDDSQYCTEKQELGGNLVWRKMMLEYGQLYARFHPYAIIDGDPRTVQVLSDLNSTDFTIIAQHFWDYLEIDPDFSLLTDDIASSTSLKQLGEGCTATFKPSKSKLSRAVSIVIGVSGAVVLIAATAASIKYYFMKKRVSKQEDVITNLHELYELYSLPTDADVKIRILFAESNPPGTMPTFANMAIRELEKFLPTHHALAVTWEILQEKIEKLHPTMLHIWAHGERDGDVFGIVLSDNDTLPLEQQRQIDNFTVDPKQLAELIKRANIECVLFSVCNSAVFVEETFLQANCFCIGFDGLVNPRYMARWAEGFYQGLVNKKPLHECIEEGLVHLQNNPIRDNKKTEENEFNKFKQAFVIRQPL